MENFQNDSSQPCVCIGSKLRLLSQLKVRYEGTLYSVDTNKSTISLKNVKTFGTEGRSVDGNEVPGSDEIFDIIIFRAADISEIFMIEAPTAVSVDPAIVDYQQTREKQNAANAVPPQRDFPPGHNVTSVSDSRVSTPGPESVQSGGDVHHVPRHDVGHIGAKAVNKGWGADNRRGDNDRDHQAWGPSHRGAQFDRRPAPADGRRERDNYGERNGPYSAVERKMPTNNGNARPYPNQGRGAGYGYNNDGGSRQTSGRQPGYYVGQQGGSHYGPDQEHRSGGFRQGDNGGRSGWREQRDRPDYQRAGRDVGSAGQRGYYNQREGGDDRHQGVSQQHRRQQYVNARDPQQSQRGRGQLPQRKERGQQGGQRSRDRENQHDRDSQSASNSKNVPEFDFEKANEEFSKLDLDQAAATPVAPATATGDKEAETSGNTTEANENKEGAAPTESAEPSYQKDSFFDEISRDSRQAQRPKTSERSLNMQTFGAAATRRRPTTGRYYNRRPGNWTGSGNTNGGEASTNGTAQVSA